MATRGAWTALMLLTLLWMSQGAAAAPYLQAGHDAARTGATPDAGPDSDDRAFVLRLGGSRATHAPPLLFDGAVWLAIADRGYSGLHENALLRVDLATADAEEIAALPAPPSALVSDGTRLVVAHEKGIEAYAVGDRRSVWRAPYPSHAVNGETLTRCVDPAHRNGTIYLACTAVGAAVPLPDGDDPFFDPAETHVFVLALEAATGVVRWHAPMPDPEPTESVPQVPDGAPPNLPRAAPREAWAVTLAGPVVVLTTLDHGRLRPEFLGFDAEDGASLWRYDPTVPGVQSRPTLFPANPIGTPSHVFVRYANWLERFDATDVRKNRYQEQPESERNLYGESWSAMALTHDGIYVAAIDHVARVDLASLEDKWRITLPVEQWSTTGILVASDRLYGIVKVFEDVSAILAIDTADGSVLWRDDITLTEHRHRAHSVEVSFGIGEGVLALATSNGELRVLGQTAASLQPVVQVSDLYPSPGARVAVDLSGTRAGVHGPATSYRAEWGDGTATDWQSDPVLVHTYEAPGSRDARVIVRNDAGQTSSVPLVFDVGGTPPPDGRASALRLPDWLDPSALLTGLIAALTVLILVSRLGPGARLRPPPTSMVGALVRGDVVMERYRILETLGQGSFGVAYLAEDRTLGRRVVLKKIWNRDGEERFLMEAKRMATLHHPCVVTIFDVHHSAAGAFIAMEFVDGGSLRDQITKGPLHLHRFHRVAKDLLGALDAVHAAEMVHRDVKPSNVLLTSQGAAKLADFGIASDAPSDQTATSVTAPGPGTARYMSPEQARGGSVTEHSDLYSAAVTLYEALTGRPYIDPINGEEPGLTRRRAMEPYVAKSLAYVPIHLLPWFARALQPNPADRYPSAREMRETLEGLERRGGKDDDVTPKTD